jgi:GntR family transcriptional regulator
MGSPRIIRIDVDSPVPAYRQIADAIRALMVEGELRAGDLLPTVRQLAVDLAVHHNTVAQAYRDLAEEGWLDLRRGRGAVVTARSTPRPSSDAEASFRQQLRELIAKARAAGLSPQAVAKVLAQSSQIIKETPS